MLLTNASCLKVLKLFYCKVERRIILYLALKSLTNRCWKPNISKNLNLKTTKENNFVCNNTGKTSQQHTNTKATESDSNYDCRPLVKKKTNQTRFLMDLVSPGIVIHFKCFTNKKER